MVTKKGRGSGNEAECGNMKKLNFVVLMSGILFVFGCSKDKDSGWSDARFNEMVSNCSSAVVSPPTNFTTSEANQYCVCYMSVVKNRFSYDEYVLSPYEKDLALEREGAFNYCGF